MSGVTKSESAAVHRAFSVRVGQRVGGILMLLTTLCLTCAHTAAQQPERPRRPQGITDPALLQKLRKTGDRPESRSPVRTVERAVFETPAVAETGLQADVRLQSPTNSAPDETVRPAASELQPVVGVSTPTVEDMNASVVNGSVEAASPAPFLDLRGESASSSREAIPAAVSHQKTPDPSDAASLISRAVAWIVIALCLFSLSALGVRRWQRQRGLLPVTNSRSRVVETLSVGPGRTVSLIELAGYRALVAADAGGIRQLVLAPMSFPQEWDDAIGVERAESGQKLTEHQQD